MNEELIKDKIETHNNRLNNHAGRLDKLEQDNASFRVELKNLCDNLKALTSVLKGLIGLGATTLLGFFIYSIENLIK
jgi:predicted nuclease with TOPRIM domain